VERLKQIWTQPGTRNARKTAAALVEDYGTRFSDAVRCLDEGLEDSLAFNAFQDVDKKKIYLTNGV